MAKTHDVTVTYLEMTQDPHLHAAVPVGQLALMRCHNPPVHFYRYLYETVGRDYVWVDRRRLDDEALAKIVHSDETEIYVLYSKGAPAGFGELNFREFPQVELAFMGLMPDAIGRGLGRYLLSQLITTAWSRTPNRLIVETCTLDHPGALPLYQRCGFVPYAQRQSTVTDFNRTT